MVRRLPPHQHFRLKLMIWERDGHQCQSPLEPPICVGKPYISFKDCDMDHIRAGKQGTNDYDNLRILCPICHALRDDGYHVNRLMEMLEAGRMPVGWHLYKWDG